MHQIELPSGGEPSHILFDQNTALFSFPLSATDQQADVVYFDRPGEVHVNLALGRLCPVGCQECSATLLSRGLVKSLRGNLSPAAIHAKVRSIVANLAPTLAQRKVVISTMNDGDPLSRSPQDLIAVVQSILRGCQDAGLPLDRLNLSSSLIPTRFQTIIHLADHYADAFGTHLVQWQGSLLATHVKRNVFAGDQSALRTMIEALGTYRESMRTATGRGETWINYVAVKRGDFGRADGADRLDTVAKVADMLLHIHPAVRLKITRGMVATLDGWQQLSDDEYAAFVHAVQERWGVQLSIYCPDLAEPLADSYHCGRIQALTMK